MKNIFFLTLIPILVFITSTSFAASPYFFNGYVHVNGSLAPNGTIVEIRVAGTNKYNVSVGEGTLLNRPQGWYVISFTADSGNNVTFQVNGLNLLNTNGTDNTTQILTSSNIIERFNLSVNKSANTVACEVASGCTGGFCVHAICRSASTFCGDAFCDTGESCSSDNSACSSGQACTNGCVATSTASTGGSSGGGGGGGSTTSPEGPKKIALPADDITLSSVSAGATSSATLDEPQLAVNQVELTTAVAAQNVKVEAKEVSQPSGVSAPISSAAGSVYKYVEITAKNIQSTGISKAKVKFKVENSWLSDNSIDSSTVKLNRLVGTRWTTLVTGQTSRDGTYTYYEADAPGLSTFAITGEKAKGPVCGNGAIESGEECDANNLGSQTCATRGYESGTLRCANCRFDASGCIAAQPEEQPLEEGIERPERRIPDAGVDLILIITATVLIIIIIAYILWVRPKKAHQYHHYTHPHGQ